LQLPTHKRLMIFSGTANRALAEEVAEHLGMKLGEVEVSTFANSETYVRFSESVRGCDAFVIQTICDPVDHNVMQHFIMIDALKRASAKRITAVCPFYPYSRQDRKARGREPITAKLMADFYEAAGADRSRASSTSPSITSRRFRSSPISSRMRWTKSSSSFRPTRGAFVSPTSGLSI
jgi:ribose-phosphate pyrophosphokinase